MSWTIEFGRETPKDGKRSIMPVHNEAEAVRRERISRYWFCVVMQSKDQTGQLRTIKTS
jgi:hypothetical protein